MLELHKLKGFQFFFPTGKYLPKICLKRTQCSCIILCSIWPLHADKVPKPICIFETVKVTTVFQENKTTNNSYRAIVEPSYFAHAEKLLNVQHLNYAHTKH